MLWPLTHVTLAILWKDRARECVRSQDQSGLVALLVATVSYLRNASVYCSYRHQGKSIDIVVSNVPCFSK